MSITTITHPSAKAQSSSALIPPGSLPSQSKFQGCLLGGAAGDALGYAVEFDPLNVIWEKHGPLGIQSYRLHPRRNVALISDDTQMTLFTATGLTAAWEVGATDAEEIVQQVRYAYLDWFSTQNPRYAKHPRSSWLLKVPALHDTRAPEVTCLAVLQNGGRSSMESPANENKGCGGLMRVSPAGLLYENPRKAAIVAAECAAITHGHPLGYLPAAALACIIGQCALVPQSTSFKHAALRSILEDCCRMLPTWFPREKETARQLVNALALAARLSSNAKANATNLRQLGEGWTAEEALAIGIYSALRHTNDFSAGIRCAVNHSGNSDTTGSICGSILGALLGTEGIASEWIGHLELAAVITKTADALYRARLGNAEDRLRPNETNG